MIIDAKRIWVSGGYGNNNRFEPSMRFVRAYAEKNKVNSAICDAVIANFFIELKTDERKYRFEGNVCPCGCGINKSGTAAVHELLKRIDKKSTALQQKIEDTLADEINALIINHMKKDNEEYIAKHAPLKGTWGERNLPTFRKLLRIK